MSRKASDLAMRSGVIALILPDAMMRLPKKWPMKKLHWSPTTAATHTSSSRWMMSRPLAGSCAKKPAANRRESPGRKGMKTTPVSMKMIKKMKP